jgi:hypothetical protein
VFLQILWRYKEQQSFYLSDAEWEEHCEAVADLVKKWDAVEYFCDYVANVKKKREFDHSRERRRPYTFHN